MQITTISVQKARELIAQGAVLIDIRSRKEHEDCHIDGCVLDTLKEGVDPLADCKGKVVIFSCLSGMRTGMQAKALEKRAEEAGCADCHLLDGGYNAWKSAGFPVVEKPSGGPASQANLMRQAQFTIGFLTVAGALLTIFAHPGFIALPILLGCGLMFAGLTGHCAMVSLMGCMPWNNGGCCGRSCACSATGDKNSAA